MTARGWRDISIALGPGAPEWPGDTPYSCRWTQQLARGDSVNLSAVTTSPHVGTHADAPLHVHDGWPASHELPVGVFAGPATVCSFDRVDALPRGPLERLLLRTGATTAGGAFPADWPALSVRHIESLLARGLRLLGVDAPSVDTRHSTTLEVHHALFAGGAYNLENLDLRDVPDGQYDLVALPLKIVGLDAAPVRAILRPHDSIPR
ncbi:MAG TPA: cyclase family protein [Gemmatimonadaceae bacterium]|nr:cyclase family protein [Gemmatimonadaceae bacterium]